MQGSTSNGWKLEGGVDGSEDYALFLSSVESQSHVRLTESVVFRDYDYENANIRVSEGCGKIVEFFCSCPRSSLSMSSCINQTIGEIISTADILSLLPVIGEKETITFKKKWRKTNDIRGIDRTDGTRSLEKILSPVFEYSK